jgi:hypothetical protein
MNTTAKPSWRDTIPVHPAAELFPPMSPDELRELGDDIKKNGLTSPIGLWQDGDEGYLLDGRNRLDALEIALGRQVRIYRSRKRWTIQALDEGEWGSVDDFLDRAGPLDQYLEVFRGDDPFAYVVSANIRRRHLSAEQKRELIVKLIKAEPTKSNRQVATTVGVSHPHIAKVRAELEQAGDVETGTTSIDTKGRAQPAKKTATAPNTTASTSAKTRGDIGPASSGEIERLSARNEELERENHRLQRENAELRREIEELRARLIPPAPSDDGTPANLRRAAP